ncbi:hypothetical protein [Fluviicola sp.]|uniref:hypothetical protein n=1 Tax=Fluviicola sp. TaxID=1917219 RepID=UPI0031DDD15D
MKLLFALFNCCLLLLIISCKKQDKKHPIQFTIKSHIPYSGEPISGVKYTITEYRSKKFSEKLSDIEYIDFKLEGYTNTSGLAVISFLPKKTWIICIESTLTILIFNSKTIRVVIL